MIPYHYAWELIEKRVSGSTRRITYVEDELFRSYAEGAIVNKYSDVNTPEPNLLFKGKIIRPYSAESTCPTCGRRTP